jgi:hypothetical protein
LLRISQLRELGMGKNSTQHYYKHPMRSLKSVSAAAVCAAFLFSAGSLRAADAKSYQVTGPVLEVTPTTITVQKGQERWEIGRGKETKVTGELKVGARVTVYYRMVAEEIEVKEGKGKGPAKETKEKN